MQQPLVKKLQLCALMALTCLSAMGNASTINSALDGDAAAVPAAAPDLASQLVMQALGLIGTRYKSGGNSPEIGFDCSGFVRHLFGLAVGRPLPRTSVEMSRLGEKIARGLLEPGDLVFYNTRQRAFSHVGIYIGEGRFIHAPSKGRAVEIVDLGDPYWARRFNGARRLLPTIIGPALPSTSATAP